MSDMLRFQNAGILPPSNYSGKPRLLLQIFEECNHEADYCGHQAL